MEIILGQKKVFFFNFKNKLFINVIGRFAQKRMKSGL